MEKVTTDASTRHVTNEEQKEACLIFSVEKCALRNVRTLYVRAFSRLDNLSTMMQVL